MFLQIIGPIVCLFKLVCVLDIAANKYINTCRITHIYMLGHADIVVHNYMHVEKDVVYLCLWSL